MGAYADAVIAAGAALYWKLDEASGDPQDSSGNNRHATAGQVVGMAYRSAGVGSPLSGGDELYAIESNTTTGDKVRRDSVAGLDAATSVTYECWWKRGADDNADGLLFEIGRAIMVGNGCYLHWQDSDGKLVCKKGSDGTVMCQSDAAITADTWYHIAIVENGGTWTMYVNGVAQATANAKVITAPASSISLFKANDNDLLHGEGLMAHFAIYQTALSGATIASHAAGAAGGAAGGVAGWGAAVM